MVMVSLVLVVLLLPLKWLLVDRLFPKIKKPLYDFFGFKGGRKVSVVDTDLDVTEPGDLRNEKLKALTKSQESMASAKSDAPSGTSVAKVPAWESLKKFMSQRLVRACIILLLYGYTTAANVIFQTVICVESFGQLVLFAYPNQQCFTGAHTGAFAFAILCLVFYLIGLPFWLGFMLYRNRKRLDDPYMLYQYGYIYTSFKRDHYFTGVLWVLTLFMQGMAFALPDIPAFLCSVVPFLFFFIYITAKRPFKKIYLNVFAGLLLLFAILVRIFIYANASSEVFFVAAIVFLVFGFVAAVGMIVSPFVIAAWERFMVWRVEQKEMHEFARRSSSFGNALETHYNMGFEPPAKSPDPKDEKVVPKSFIDMSGGGLDDQAPMDKRTLKKMQRESKTLMTSQGEFSNPMFSPKAPTESDGPLPGQELGPEGEDPEPSKSRRLSMQRKDTELTPKPIKPAFIDMTSGSLENVQIPEASTLKGSKRTATLKKGGETYSSNDSITYTNPLRTATLKKGETLDNPLKASFIDMSSGSTENVTVVANSPYSLTTKRKQKKISEDLTGFTEEETFENPLFAKAQEDGKKKPFILMN